MQSIPNAEKNDGWETSPNILDFADGAPFKSFHRYRRRKWVRVRTGDDLSLVLPGINGYAHPERLLSKLRIKDQDNICFRVNVQAEGGPWTRSPEIPSSGSAFGVIRARGKDEKLTNAVYELCYRISPLDAEWGTFSRSMIVTSRFTITNYSESFSFLVKQERSFDTSATEIHPG